MKYDWLESHGRNENLFLLMFFSPLLGASGFWYILFIIYLLFALWHHKERISKWGIFYAFLYILFLFENMTRFLILVSGLLQRNFIWDGLS